MKKQHLSEQEEIAMLAKEINPSEMYILGFLKGFSRKTLEDWNDKGIFDFSVDYG